MEDLLALLHQVKVMEHEFQKCMNKDLWHCGLEHASHEALVLLLFIFIVYTVSESGENEKFICCRVQQGQQRGLTLISLTMWLGAGESRDMLFEGVSELGSFPLLSSHDLFSLSSSSSASCLSSFFLS